MPNIAPDSAAHHEWLTSLVELPTSGVVLDLGCGGGYDLMTLAQRATTSDVTFLGVDRSAKAIEKAKAQSPATAGVRFEAVDLTATLPWEDGSIDVVFSNNYLECVEDVAEFVGEVARIVRPGGQVVFAHWDWDTQVFNAKDKARVRRLVHAFADWQQGWMDHADGWMGRRLWGAFQANA